jgi:hypothetical protein
MTHRRGGTTISDGVMMAMGGAIENRARRGRTCGERPAQGRSRQ